MTFGKEQCPSENGRRGAIVTNGNREYKRKGAITRWKNEDYRKKFRLAMRKSRAWSKEHLSEMGKKSRERENKAIGNIECEYDQIFLPQEVCDRIAIRNGKLFFIEVKGPKQKLTPKQKEFKETTKDNYLVVRSI